MLHLQSFSAYQTLKLVTYLQVVTYLQSGNILGKASNTLNDLRNIPAGDNIPLDTGNILTKRDNIPVSSGSNILLESSNIPFKSLVMEVLPGKQKA
jgi:hypothetical protein